MRRIATLALVLAAYAPLSACGSSSSVRPASPKDVRASIIAAALAQKSVHWTWDSGSKAGDERITADVTAHGGRQRLSSWPHSKAEIRLVNDIAYVRGNSAGLREWLGLDMAQSTRYAGQWISIPRGDKLYARTADEVTLPSIVHDFVPSAGRLGKLIVSYGPTGADGPTGLQGPTGAGVGSRESAPTRPAILQAGPTGTSLSLRTSGEPLPITYSVVCVACWDNGTFSRWNEPVHVQAPAHSVPMASVRASSNLHKP
jgi:hypothetical protein